MRLIIYTILATLIFAFPIILISLLIILIYLPLKFIRKIYNGTINDNLSLNENYEKTIINTISATILISGILCLWGLSNIDNKKLGFVAYTLFQILHLVVAIIASTYYITRSNQMYDRANEINANTPNNLYGFGQGELNLDYRQSRNLIHSTAFKLACIIMLASMILISWYNDNAIKIVLHVVNNPLNNMLYKFETELISISIGFKGFLTICIFLFITMSSCVIIFANIANLNKLISNLILVTKKTTNINVIKSINDFYFQLREHIGTGIIMLSIIFTSGMISFFYTNNTYFRKLQQTFKRRQ